MVAYLYHSIRKVQVAIRADRAVREKLVCDRLALIVVQNCTIIECVPFEVTIMPILRLLFDTFGVHDREFVNVCMCWQVQSRSHVAHVAVLGHSISEAAVNMLDGLRIMAPECIKYDGSPAWPEPLRR